VDQAAMAMISADMFTPTGRVMRWRDAEPMLKRLLDGTEPGCSLGYGGPSNDLRFSRHRVAPRATRRETRQPHRITVGRQCSTRRILAGQVPMCADGLDWRRGRWSAATACWARLNSRPVVTMLYGGDESRHLVYFAMRFYC